MLLLPQSRSEGVGRNAERGRGMISERMNAAMRQVRSRGVAQPELDPSLRTLLDSGFVERDDCVLLKSEVETVPARLHDRSGDRGFYAHYNQVDVQGLAPYAGTAGSGGPFRRAADCRAGDRRSASGFRDRSRGKSSGSVDTSSGEHRTCEVDARSCCWRRQGLLACC